MLKKVDLDYTDYNLIMNQVMENLSKHDYQWNRYQVSDSGMAILELLALLTDMQNYYLNSIGEEHIKKLIKLLGIEEQKTIPAKAILQIKEPKQDITLLKGVKCYAGNVVFETEDTLNIRYNRIVSITFGSDQGKELVSLINLKRESSFSLLQHVDNNNNILFQIGLKNPIPKNEEIPLFFVIDDNGGRNVRGTCGESDFKLGELVWEAYTENDWEEVVTVRDDTCNFLYSGIVKLFINCVMTEKPNNRRHLYYLRCRIIKDEYEVSPIIQSIHINDIPVVQKDTRCFSKLFSYSGAVSEIIQIEEYLAIDGVISVYVKRQDDLWDDFTGYVEIFKTMDEGCFITFDVMRFGKVPEKGISNIKVVCSTKDCNENFKTLNIDGVTCQKIAFWEFCSTPVTLEFMLKVEDGIYREYKRSYCYEGGKETNFSWYFDEDNKEIIFGNGRNFFIPKRMDAGLKITDLVFCNGKDGNVRTGRINGMDDGIRSLGIKVINPYPAKGGRDSYNAKDYPTLINSYMAQNERAVTLEDYVKIIRSTPGLLPVRVKAEKDMEHVGVIRITIFCPTNWRKGCWVSAYQKAIRKQILKVGLITARIKFCVEVEQG